MQFEQNLCEKDCNRDGRDLMMSVRDSNDGEETAGELLDRIEIFECNVRYREEKEQWRQSARPEWANSDETTIQRTL